MSEKLLFWGIDGCKAGWFCIGLGEGADYDCFVACNIEEVYKGLPENAKRALIDIPIGFSGNADERLCDKGARQYLKPKGAVVFRVPCRQAIEAYRKASGDRNAKQKAGKLASVEVTGGCLSEQTWGIVPKIEEVDCFLNSVNEQDRKRKLFREVHPEVCFCGLNNGKPLQYPKKKKDTSLSDEKKHIGIKERLDIAEKYFPASKQVYKDCRNKSKNKEVARDDIVDALAAAITAKMSFGNNTSPYKTLPPKPLIDSCGLPMEMLYIEPSFPRRRESS